MAYPSEDESTNVPDPGTEKSSGIAKAGDDEPLESLFLSDELNAGLAAAFGSKARNEPKPAWHRDVCEAGTIIARKYRLIERIGEGGMGFVWYAEQLEPVKRKVAIKLIKPGLDSRSVVARFEAERQALAMMDHPNIARVFDGGISESGHPFFVMELVRGTSITRWCDENKLDLRGRLELLIPVCQAIHHAHQKGIIHRDIKPSNVMIAMFDGKPVPKVIDFGVAKAFGTSLIDESLHTAFGAVVGTAEYMSPEQAELNNLDIDTRSDVYSLGVLMYELLAGSPPFSRAELAERGWQELLRVIREVDPQRPSVKLSSSKMRASIATLRGTEPGNLGKLLKSELDWIVMKSLEKERSRRYESASAMASDLQRYLTDEPVVACPPSLSYRTRKFMRRNSWSIAACLAILTALIVGFIGTSLGFVRAESQRKVAEQARIEADERAAGELAAKSEAQRLQKIAEEAEYAALESYRESTNEAIEKLIGSKPVFGYRERSYLESAHRRWQSFADRQGNDERSRNVRAMGSFYVGVLWRTLGKHAEANTALTQAVELWSELAKQFPSNRDYAVDVAKARRERAIALRSIGNTAAAEADLKAALQSLDALAKANPAERRFRFELANCHNTYAGLLKSIGRPETETEHREALKMYQMLASDFPNDRLYQFHVAQAQSNLGNQLAELGHTTEPEKLFRAALATSSKLVTEVPESDDYQHALAERHVSLGRFLRYRLAHPNEAIEELLKGVQILDKLATDQPSVPYYCSELADACDDVSNILLTQGRMAEAETRLNQAVQSWSSLVADYPQVTEYKVSLASTYNSMGRLFNATGKDEDALGWFDRGLFLAQQVHDQQTGRTVVSEILFTILQDRALLLDKLGRAKPQDWEAVREHIPKDGAPFSQILRSIMLLRAGKSTEAEQEISTLVEAANSGKSTVPWTFIEWFNAACFYSIASRVQPEQRDAYADQAMAMLTRAVREGFDDAMHIKQDQDLEPLRERDDFKKLIESMKK